jgi:exocyst complex component 6
MQPRNSLFVVKAQSNLIIPYPFNLTNLPTLIQEISGFFIVENYVLETAGTFRSPRNVEELWDTLVKGLTAGVEQALSTELDPDVFLKTKECLISFLMTLEVRDVLVPMLDHLIQFHRHLHTLRGPYIRFCRSFLKNTHNCLKPSLVINLNL